jgi:hypothetical protein
MVYIQCRAAPWAGLSDAVVIVICGVEIMYGKSSAYSCTCTYAV